MGRKGWTFIELIITIAILAVLASVVVPLSHMSVKRSKEVELRRDLRMLRTAIDDYKRAWDEGRIIRKVDESGYPEDLMVLVEGIEDAKSPESDRRIRFLRRIPRDPMSQDIYSDPEETWGLRSYESDPDSPEEGDDVFDVYSRSEETAIDGTLYSSW
ncbi:MAG: type II secretion system protein [Thermodesulfobacteriota bacterium]